MRRFVIVVLTVILALNCSCGPEKREDYYIQGMEHYGNEDSSPEDGIPSFSFSSFSDVDISVNDALKSEYHYYIKNAPFYTGIPFGPGEYGLIILILEYDDVTYQNTKKILFEAYEYTTQQPKHIINGYDFFEYSIAYWTADFRFLYHTFNDEKNKIIMLAYETGYPYAEDFVKERENDFAGMLEKYFGEFYSFNE